MEIAESTQVELFCGGKMLERRLELGREEKGEPGLRIEVLIFMRL